MNDKCKNSKEDNKEIIEDSKNVPKKIAKGRKIAKNKKSKATSNDTIENLLDEPSGKGDIVRSKDIDREEDSELLQLENTKTDSEEENTSGSVRISRSNKSKNKKDVPPKKVVHKISEKSPSRRQKSQDCSFENQNELSNSDDDDFIAPAPMEHVERCNRSSDIKKNSTPSPKEPRQKREHSKVQSDSCQNSTDESVKEQLLKTPIKRRKSGSSQSNSESSPMVTLKHPKSNQLSSPSSRNMMGHLKPKVMFTGLTDDKSQKIVTDLGGSVVTTFDNCTHLVTDKIRRTVKLLCCLTRGIPIVSPCWLTNCKFAKMFIDYVPHILSDPASEKQYKFSLCNTLQQARRLPLLEGYSIHVTKSVKPNAAQMREIIESCKAKYLESIPHRFEENTVVISCEEDETMCQKSIKVGIPIVGAEFLLTGILQQDASINKYQLFENISNSRKRKPSKTENGKSKKRKH